MTPPCRFHLDYDHGRILGATNLLRETPAKRKNAKISQRGDRKKFFLQKILKIKNKKHFINTKKPSGEIFGTLFTPPRGASFNQKRC